MTSTQAAELLQKLGARHPRALDLARLLSFAAIIEPALLRRMRFDLLPLSSAADEADLWFSDIVQSRAPSGIVFFPEVAELLRSGIAAPLREPAWLRVSEMHRHLRRAIRTEEELAYLGSAPQPDPVRIKELLGDIIGAMVKGAPGLANWAGRAAPRLPASLQSLDSVSALRVASDLRLGRNPDWRGMLSGASAMPDWIAPLLLALKPVHLQVSLAANEILLGPTAPGVTSPFARSIKVPDTPTVAVEIRWSEPHGPASKIVFMERGEKSQPITVGPGAIELITLANESWTVTPVAQAGRTAAQPPAVTACTDGFAVTLHWRTHEKIPGCLGFALMRRVGGGSDANPQSEVLSSQIGLEEAAGGPTTSNPVQRYRWIDRPPRGAGYSYRVVPVAGDVKAPTLLEQLASEWTSFLWVGPESTAIISATFNRSYEAAEALGLTASDLQALSSAGFLPAVAQPGNRVREALGGDLLSSLKGLLRTAIASSQTIYAAIFELQDPEIIQMLQELGKRASVVLGNAGAATGKAGPNEAAAKKLRQSGVNVFDRHPPAANLAHNKFMVVCEVSGSPQTVWTGNVSWHSAALCARSNAAIIVNHTQLAQAYLNYWNRLIAPEAVRRIIKPFASEAVALSLGSATLKPWFTPAVAQADLRDLSRYIENARQGILFLISDPGQRQSLLETILNQKNLHVAGVTRNGQGLTLYEGGKATRISGAKNVSPAGIAPGPQSQLGAALQARMIVIDPMSSSPVVAIGTHSFGIRGSRSNEENFLIVENDPNTARRCAAYIECFYRHYSFRATASKSSAPFHLRPDDSWQDRSADPGRQMEINFWMGNDVRSFAPPGSAAAEDTALRPPAETKKRVAPARRKAPPKPAAKPKVKKAAKPAAKKPAVVKRTVKPAAKKSAAMKRTAKPAPKKPILKKKK